MALLTQHVHFLYWKLPQYQSMLWFQKLVSIGAHQSYQGIRTLLYRVFTDIPSSAVSLTVWLERLQLWLSRVNMDSTSGEQYIDEITSKDTRAFMGYVVVLPKPMGIESKSFSLSVNVNKAEALLLAVAYRDMQIAKLLSEGGLT